MLDLTPPNPDPVVAVLCAIGAVSGVWKGASWVVLRLVSLVAAIVLALMWHDPVGAWIDENISFVPDPLAKWLAGFLILGERRRSVLLFLPLAFSVAFFLVMTEGLGLYLASGSWIGD